jgi:heme/copper-type cytochrome/quinol oxidase subunit 1
LFIGFPVFVFLGYLNLFPELLKANEVGHWDDHYVWIPAISSLGLTLIFIFAILRFFKNINIFFLSSFLMFSVVGGLTGLKIVTDLLFKTRVLGTLFMPGHFHPLLLGGFTFSVIVYLLNENQDLKTKVQKISRMFLWGLFVGVLSFSSFLMYLGFDRSLRRHPVLVDVRSGYLSWVLLVLAGVAIFSLLALVLRLVVLKPKNRS